MKKILFLVVLAASLRAADAPRLGPEVVVEPAYRPDVFGRDRIALGGDRTTLFLVATEEFGSTRAFLRVVDRGRIGERVSLPSTALPSIASLGDTRLVAWIDATTSSAPHPALGQRFTRDGAAIDTTPLILDFDADDVEVIGNAGLFHAFSRRSGFLSDTSLDASGHILAITPRGATGQTRLAVATNGQRFTTWAGSTVAGSIIIGAPPFLTMTVRGSAAGDIDKVLDLKNLPPSFRPFVATAVATNGSGFLATWLDSRTILAERFDAAGKLLDAKPIRIATVLPNETTEIVMAWTGIEYLAVWTTLTEDGTTDVLGAMVSADGVAGAPFAIASSAADERAPAVLGFGDGGAIVAWEVFAGSASQIRTRMINDVPRSRAVRPR